MSNPEELFPNDKEWLEYLGAYLNENYAAYVQLVTPHLNEKPDNLYLYLFVISLQRLNEVEILEQIVPGLLAVPDLWTKAVLRHTLGRSNSKQFLKQADTPFQRCVAHFYIASRLVTLNQLEEARCEFQACLQTTIDEGIASRETMCAISECNKRGWSLPM